MPNLTFEALTIFLLVIVPGFVSIKIYDIVFPPEKRSFGDLLVDSAVYGLINFAIWGWAIIDIDLKALPKADPFTFAWKCLVCLIASPAILAFLFTKVRKWEWLNHQLHFDHPYRTAWDFVFHQPYCCYIKFYLKTGKTLAGYFGSNSYVSMFPHKPEVFVEQVWKVEDDRLIEQVKGVNGMLIRYEDCERIELIQAKEPRKCKAKNPVSQKPI